MVTCNAAAHESVCNIARILPGMCVLWNITKRTRSMMGGVGAHPVPVASNRLPPGGPEGIILSVRPVGQVVCLSKVERLGIRSAIVRVVANWLHSALLAGVDHDLAEALAVGRLADFYHFEDVFVLWDFVF